MVNAELTTAEYLSYMDFQTVEPNPWTTDYLQRHLQALGVTRPSVTDTEVAVIFNCYDQESRFYHGLEHGAFVGQAYAPEALRLLLSDRMSLEEAQAILAIAGLFHDTAYKHIDAVDNEGTGAWTEGLTELVGEVIEYTVAIENDKPIFRTRLTEAGKNDPITQLVAEVFDLPAEGFIHNQGGNEFESAVAAAKFLAKKGAPLKSIIAVAAAIEATIPFRPATGVDEQGRPTDGRMGELADRVTAALERTGASLPEHSIQDTDDIMLLSVYMANRDISDFLLPDNFAQVVHGGRGIKAEEQRPLRKAAVTTRELARVAGITQSAPLLYGSLGGKETMVPARNVPHFYMLRKPRHERQKRAEANNSAEVSNKEQPVEVSYPPRPVYEKAVEHTRENTRLASRFFVIHELGILAATAIFALGGEPDAPVPGAVDSELWDKKAVLPTGHLSPEDAAIYQEMVPGGEQKEISAVTSRLSPIAGTILAALGSEGVEHVSNYVQQIRAKGRETGNLDPFSDPIIAENFIQELKSRMSQTALGARAYNMIIKELHRVATSKKWHNPARAAALAELVDGFIEY